MKLGVENGKVTSAERYTYSQDEYEIVEYADEDTLNIKSYEDYVFVPDKNVKTTFDAYRRVKTEESKSSGSATYENHEVTTEYTYDESHRLIKKVSNSTIGKDENAEPIVNCKRDKAQVYL